MLCTACQNLFFVFRLFLILVCLGFFTLNCGGSADAVLPEQPNQDSNQDAVGEGVSQKPAAEETPLVVSTNEPADKVATGLHHVCKLVERQIICWGDNSYEQREVVQRDDYLAMAAGLYHTCGLTTEGAVYCWGDNRFRQLEVKAGSYTSLFAGAFHTCALNTYGQAICWGDNRSNQQTPLVFETQYTSLGLGKQHSCGLQENGNIDCWGGNLFGQSETPEGSGYLQVASGDAHTCAIDAEGLVLCWGKNDFGQSEVPNDLGAVKRIFLGPQNTCALDHEYEATCWGANDKNQSAIPVGKYTHLSLAQNFGCGITLESAVVCWGDGQPEPTGFQYKQVAAGLDHNCAITNQDYLVCWGYNRYGQVTIPQEYNRARFSQVTAGAYHSCAITKEAPQLICWGNENEGKLVVPAIEEGKGTYYKKVAAGRDHICAITDTDHLYCWGWNRDQQTMIPPQHQDAAFQDIDPGFNHTCAVKSDTEEDGGRIYCWGNNSHDKNQLPEGYEEAVFTQVALGTNHSCGILAENNQILCWGRDGEGQTSIPQSQSFQDLQFREVKTKYDLTCGLSLSGSVYCWGDDRSVEDALNPINSDELAFETISVGKEHFCGILTDGSLQCLDGFGRDYNDAHRIKVPARYESQAFVTIQAGDSHVCGILVENNQVVCWGNNTNNQLNVPENIIDSAINSLSVGYNNNCVLLDQVPSTNSTNLVCWGIHSLKVPLVYREATFLDISVGANHICGITRDESTSLDELVCWGTSDGDFPEGGEIWEFPESMLSYLPGEHQLKIFDSDYQASCGLSRDQTIFCWGNRSRDLPQKEDGSGPLEFSNVDVGTSFACGILVENNRLVCWGSNVFGRVNGYLPDYENHEFLDVSAGYAHSCGILVENNRLVCWERNNFGELNPPLQYEAQNRFIQVSVGSYFTCGILQEGRRALCWGRNDGRLLEAPRLY